MEKFEINVLIRAHLVKRFVVEANCRDDAEHKAEQLADADIESGCLDGWDMTTDSVVVDMGLIEEKT